MKDRFRSEYYDPTKVCPEVLESLRESAQLMRGLHGGTLPPETIERFRMVAKIDRQGHGINYRLLAVF